MKHQHPSFNRTAPVFPTPIFQMGCCISKCSPDQHPLQEFIRVQEKLVVSQPPPPPIPHSNQISPSPPSPTSSTSSVSSFTCTSTSNTILTSASSLSSASSSALTSKDRSFSNEFLWSCYKDNPHIVRINSLKEASLSLVPTKPQTNNINPCPAKSSLAPSAKFAGSSVPQKRLRSSSPANLTRQKSLRKEAGRPNSAYNLPSRTLRSPSPSRRFDGGNNNGLANRIMISPRAHRETHSHSVSSLIPKENMKAASPNRSFRGLRRRENCSYRVGSKIEETVVKEVESKHDMESAMPMGMMEDIHNPLISLDCFIFL